ncbi:MAG: bifunctional diaminohydroxyphosphoribosylaminopyrimidine deaminase/5-amino-6-(5-phosphoribosylamino)uracil reductase RibD [Bacteroidota bacterium]
MTLNTAQKSFFMQAALAESRLALPHCLPNPPVGCIIVREGKIVAKAYTLPPGQPHAEASALAKIEGDLSDCEVFVTLEPCSFQGRTPSCAKSLVPRKPKVVHIAILDPDPRNQGRGIEIMREGGLDVRVGLLAEQVQSFLEPYLNLTENQI